MKYLLILLFINLSMSFAQETQQALIQLIKFNDQTGKMMVEFPKGINLKPTSNFKVIDSYGNTCEPTLVGVEGNRALFSAAGCNFNAKTTPGKMLKLISARNLGAENKVIEPIIAIAPRKKIVRKIKEKKKEDKVVAKKNKDDWYLNLGMGYAMTSSFSSDLDAGYNSFNENYVLTGTPILLDGGLYYPKKDGTLLLGPSMIYSFQSLTGESDTATATFSHASLLVNFSMINFFGSRPGLGYFLRGDIGLSFLATETTQEFTGATLTQTYNYSTGIGIHLEYGYGFSLSEKTSALVSLAWTRADGSLNSISTENSSDGTTTEVEYTDDSSQSTISLMGHLFF